MLKVLIADDEKNICLMIQKLIPWEEKGMQVLGIVHNGIEAIRMIETKHPDIVITDIRMPGYDGLEIVRKAKEMNLDVNFIIISGYKYFEYAHTALNLGVEHYLLKPIDKKELGETLDKIVQKRAVYLQKAEKEAELEEQANYSRRKIRKHFLSSIIEKGNIQDMELTNINEEFQCDFEQGYFLAILAKIDCDVKDYDLSGLLHILEGIIDQDLQGSNKEYINSVMQSGIMTIINCRTELWKDTRIGIEKPFFKMRKELDKFQGFHITMGVGCKKNSIQEIADSIHEAIYAVKCRGKAGVDKLIYYDQLRYKKIPAEEVVDENTEKGLENMVESLDYEALNGQIGELYKKMQAAAFLSPASVYEFAERVSEIIIQVLRKNQIEEGLVQQMEYEMQKIMDFYIREDEIIYRITDVIRKFFEKIMADKKSKSQLPVRMAKQYIQEHYQKQVTLEEVACAIHLSPAYLSTMFKKELGINFSDYLISCRMESAKDLLKNTELSIAEVSEKVGYTDSRHFSKTFNKVVGLKPSVYRKLYW